MLQPLCKAVCLDLEDQLAALGAGGRIAGDERSGGDGAGECRLVQRHGERNGGMACGIRAECRTAAALALHAPEVQHGLGVAGAEGLCLGQQRAVFTDEIMRGKDHIRRGFAVPGIRIEIGAQQACGLLADELAAVFRLADGFVTCREIGKHRCPGQRMAGARRQRGPEVLADLHTEAEVRHFAAAEQQVRAEGDGRAAQCDAARFGRCGGEVTQLIELCVVRQMGLRHKAEQRPMADHGGAVIECAVHADRQADDGDELERFACAENVPQALLGGIQQRLLQKQVRAGIAGEPKLRENGKRRAVLRGLLHGGDRFLRIIGAVCHAQCGGERADLQKSVFHKGVVLSVAVLIPIIIPQTAARNKGGFGGKSEETFSTSRCYCSSCSSASNSGVEKNSPSVMPRPSQSSLIVRIFGFWLLP